MPVEFFRLILIVIPYHRKTLAELMSSGTRKLCFDGQELIQTLLDTFHYDHTVGRLDKSGTCFAERGSTDLAHFK